MEVFPFAVYDHHTLGESFIGVGHGQSQYDVMCSICNWHFVLVCREYVQLRLDAVKCYLDDA
jgi:hypothetical protein